MGKIYVGQSKLTIEVDCKGSISGVQSQRIGFKKPNNSMGSWVATLVNENTGIISYQITDENIIDEAGNWAIWADLTFNDGRKLVGEPSKLIVYNVGQL